MYSLCSPVVFALAVLPSLVAQAQNPAAPKPAAGSAAPAPAVGPAELLGRALRFTQSLPALRYEAKGTFVMPELPEEMAAQIDFGDMELPTIELELVVAMPNRFVIRSIEPGFGMVDVVCDGKQVLRSIPDMELHAVEEAPKELMAFLVKRAGHLAAPGSDNLRALLAPSGSKHALIDAKAVELVGDEKLSGRDAVHLVVKDEDIACDLWVLKGAEPWIVRHKPKAPKFDMSAVMGGAEAAGEDAGEDAGMTVDLVPALDLEFVRFGKELPKDVFAIAEPEGSTKVADLRAAMMAKMAEQMEAMGLDDMGEAGGDDGKHESVGKPAPDVELTLLDGTKAKLADHKGKVVVLDFWATWCGPCVQGLPKVAAVTQKLAAEGVVFHAVNLGEGKATVEAFLAQKKLAVSVALADEAMGEKFGVGGIPHTVVIGRDGVIHAVHVGFGPGGETRLERDIQAALGKPIDKKGDAPKTDEPKKDEPNKDEPKKDEPKNGEPKKGEPKKDEPKK